jgi:hypothetical protein
MAMLSYALRPAFTPLTVLLMILGFASFWPLGMAMLTYILLGPYLPGVEERLAELQSDLSRRWRCTIQARSKLGPRRGNTVFDEYRRRLDKELHDFEAHMRDLRRARDQEEFDRYMRLRTGRPLAWPPLDPSCH